MKKHNVILLSICLICIIFAIGAFYVVKMFINGELSDEIDVMAANVSVENCNSESFEKLVGLFNPKWSERQSDELINNYLNYIDICIDYVFENRSDTITMTDVRIEPILPDELKKYILFYNTGSGTYHINLEPNQKSGLKQHIILKKDVLSSNIENMISEMSIKLKYHANGFQHSIMMPLNLTALSVQYAGAQMNASNSGLDNIAINDKESGILLGQKIKALSDDPEMNKVVIIVDGYEITKKDVEAERINSTMTNSGTFEERVEELIRVTVLNAEAERLGILPSQDRIDNYLAQVKTGLEEGKNDFFVGYIEGMGITQDEYFKNIEDVTYKIFQREALWNQVSPEGKYGNYDDYSKYLVDKADIQILDPELKKMLN